MRKDILAVWVVLAIVLLVGTVIAPIPPEYPYTLYRLSNEQIELLEEQFRVLNNMTGACPTERVELDNFGLLRTYMACTLLYNAPSEAEAAAIAQNFLVMNTQFTGMSDSDRLTVQSYTVTDTARITLKKQAYNGVEVENTDTGLFVNTEKVWRYNSPSWYPDISAPANPIITRSEAEDMLEANGYSSISIIDKVIYPLRLPYNANADRLEFRLAWKASAADTQGGLNVVYLDAINGEEIAVIPQYTSSSMPGKIPGGFESIQSSLKANPPNLAVTIAVIAAVLLLVIFTGIMVFKWLRKRQ